MYINKPQTGLKAHSFSPGDQIGTFTVILGGVWRILTTPTVGCGAFFSPGRPDGQYAKKGTVVYRNTAEKGTVVYRNTAEKGYNHVYNVKGTVVYRNRAEKGHSCVPKFREFRPQAGNP